MAEECSRCGKCCANILLLSDKEVQKIKQYLKKHPTIKVYNRNSMLMKEDVNICPFLQTYNDGEQFCAIYSVRPSICRGFNCKEEYKKPMDYKNVRAVNMLFTFGGNNQFSIKAPDLKPINDRIKELQKKINQK